VQLMVLQQILQILLRKILPDLLVLEVCRMQ
jgi:hypothetical protein